MLTHFDRSLLNAFRKGRMIPRFRYSLRALLWLFTLAAIGSWLVARQREFSARAEEHRALSLQLLLSQYPRICAITSGPNMEAELREYGRARERLLAEADRQRALWVKYKRAAKVFWLPVEPDPPPLSADDK